MDLHQISYFLALARTLNFTRAAEQCNIAQPTLTKAIQRLEHEFGGDLIYRERQLTRLTDLGELVLPLLDQALAAADGAQQKAKNYGRKSIAPLRLSLGPAIGARLIAPTLEAMAGLIPELETEIFEFDRGRMQDSLIEGRIHASIAAGIRSVNERIDRWPLYREHYVLLMNPSHVFARLPSVPTRMLCETSWVERADCETTAFFRREYLGHGASAQGILRAPDSVHLQELALVGLGAMISPAHAPVLPGLETRPIEGNPLSADVELFAMSGRRYSPALEAFIRVLRNFARNDLGPRRAQLSVPQTSFSPATNRQLN